MSKKNRTIERLESLDKEDSTILDYIKDAYTDGISVALDVATRLNWRKVGTGVEWAAHSTVGYYHIERRNGQYPWYLQLNSVTIGNYESHEEGERAAKEDYLRRLKSIIENEEEIQDLKE